MPLPAYALALLSGKSTITASKAIVPNIDDHSGNLVLIDMEHSKIHDGLGYQLSGEVSILGAGGSFDFYIKPFSGTGIHWRDYRVSTNGAPVKIALYENPTIAVTGTQATPMNRNRFSSNVSSALISTEASASAVGSLMDVMRIEELSKTGGELEGLAAEWVMKGSNSYLMRITNEDNSAVKLTHRFFWYEHD